MGAKKKGRLLDSRSDKNRHQIESEIPGNSLIVIVFFYYNYYHNYIKGVNYLFTRFICAY